MPELEFSVINFSRLCNDVEKLKTVFECQTEAHDKGYAAVVYSRYYHM